MTTITDRPPIRRAPAYMQSDPTSFFRELHRLKGRTSLYRMSQPIAICATFTERNNNVRHLINDPGAGVSARARHYHGATAAGGCRAMPLLTGESETNLIEKKRLLRYDNDFYETKSDGCSFRQPVAIVDCSVGCTDFTRCRRIHGSATESESQWIVKPAGKPGHRG